MKKTVVIGASPDPSRYAYLAVERLKKHGHEVVPLGKRQGSIAGSEIILDRPEIQGVDTVTLYINPQHQVSWYPYILALRPARIVFNPGTENPELKKLAEDAGIQCEEACTLVLLSTDQY